MAQTTIATSADYADAMLTARKARTVLFFILLLLLAGQLTLFFLWHFNVTKKWIGPAPRASSQSASPGAAAYTPSNAPPGPGRVLVGGPGDPADYSSTTQPATRPTATALSSETLTTPPLRPTRRAEVLRYVIGVSVFLGTVCSILLALDLLLILTIMLVGRLIGISHVTRAYLWCLVLALLLFPWQAFLNNQDMTAHDFKVPGVLYTWDELVARGHWEKQDMPSRKVEILRWARFVVWPAAALIILFVVQSKSGRGLRLSLGEMALETDLDEATRPAM
jgi:hypothetical protein